ncbi:type IV pilus assembly protein PilM [Sporomusaceae bacterium BoRhaA]|nr:type IV pilus assembly protein PilM [Pelorhabdus rhamnosifermentans]
MMKLFDVMVRQLEHVFIRKSDEMIGLDIGTGFVKVAQVNRKGGQPVLTNLGRVAIPTGIMDDGYIIDVNGMTQTIRECLALSYAVGKEVVVGLSGCHVFSREITMPVMPKQELAEAVKWGLEEYVPYPVDSFYYDFDIIGSNEDGKTFELLLVAAPYEIVNPLIAAVTAAGLELVAIETEALASVRVLQKSKDSGASSGHFFVIDIGAKLSQLTIFQKGVPFYTRIVPVGGMHFTQVIMQVTGLDFNEADMLKSKKNAFLQSADFIGELSKVNQELKLLIVQLAFEGRQTLDSYITQNHQVMIDQVFLMGGGACLKNLLPELRHQMDLTIEMVNPLAFMSASTAFDPQFLERVIPQMAVAIGLALRGDA